MPAQDVFKTLPPELRAMALAGHYLQSFALMESQLNQTIGTALKLDSLQTLIVCKNIQLRDKQKIVRTLLTLTHLSEMEKKEFDTIIIRIGVLSSQDRNTVAHDVFLPDDQSDGVEFLVTKANGTLKFPSTRWSVDETEAKCEELETIRLKLKELQSRFKFADVLKAVLESQTATNLLIGSSPIEGLLSPVDLDQESHQPPSDPNSTPQVTTDAKAPETQQEPREK